eukprot:gene3592-2533_t
MIISQLECLTLNSLLVCTLALRFSHRLQLLLEHKQLGSSNTIFFSGLGLGWEILHQRLPQQQVVKLPSATKKKKDEVIVSAGRTEERKEVEKKETAKGGEQDTKSTQSKTSKKNEKDVFVCNWIDRMEHQKPFDPQELAVNGID